MKPYYILEINEFDYDKNEYSTNSQQGIDGIRDNTPTTSFNKRELQILKGFTKYDLTCETSLSKKGRAYGRDDIFERFILIDESAFYASQKHNILILSSRKDIFNKFYNDFKGNKSFIFSKIEVIFKDIIKNRKSLGIQGVWLGEIPDEVNVNTLSMFGCSIEDSTRYNQLLQDGAEIKNLSLVYDYKGNQERIMITKDGGVILYKSLEESDALLLIEDVYTKLLTSF